jgi:hypothetical protein
MTNIVLTLTSLSRMIYKGVIDNDSNGVQRFPSNPSEYDTYIFSGNGSLGNAKDIAVYKHGEWFVMERYCGHNGGSLTITAGSGLYPQAEVKPVKTNCDNCGGTVSNRVCEYCKTEY